MTKAKKTANKPIFAEWKEIEKFTHFVAEPKLDGMRCFMKKINGKLELVRDDGRSKTLQFPEIIANNDIPEGTILDGEVCIPIDKYRADFELISKRMNVTDSLKIRVRAKENPASFIAFDVIKYDSKDIRNFSYTDRRKILEDISIPRVDQIDILELKKKVKELEMEGMVVKNPNDSYNGKWIKFKNLEERDFKVIGITSVTRPISSLVLANQQGVEVGAVSYPSNRDMTINPIGKTAIVIYQVMQNKTQKLRFPVLKELRD